MSKKVFDTGIKVDKRRDGKFEVSLVDCQGNRVISAPGGRVAHSEEEARKYVAEMRRPLDQRGDTVRIFDHTR